MTWSMKLGWLLTTFQSDTASAHWRPSLVSDKHVACRFQSVSPGSGIGMWFSCSQGWKWMMHITVTSCCLVRHLSSCWQLLLFWAPCVCKSTELLRACDTRLRTSHRTCSIHTDLNPVHYRIWIVIQECICEKQQRTSNVVDELSSLT